MRHYNSRIFWHFTGSPKNIDWSKVRIPKDITQHVATKPTNEAIDILKLIINSKTLKATCKEKAYGHRESDEFCCVTDIPLSHLDSHNEFYGDVAIGFNSAKIYKEFNPVLYIPKKGLVRNAIQFLEGTEKITNLSDFGLDEESAILSDFTKNEDNTWTMPSTEIGYAPNTKLEQYLINHLKITSFSDNPGESFYQEKEWRKIGDFQFEIEDIEALLVPKEKIREMNSFLSSLDGNRGISVLTWDLLLKS
jgi:hypothetical protein